MLEAPSEVDVLVAGAGPTGLLLAGELQRRGVSSLLIDAHDAPLGWDRATVLHPRSLEILESLGLVDRVLDEGVRVKGARFHSGGEVLGVLDFTKNGSRYGFDIGISEDVTEAVLAEDLERHGGAVMRATRLVDYRADHERVVATIERDGERHDVTAQWLVGCDGFHSTVREIAGIDLEGVAPDADWAVFDATLDGWREDFDFNAGHFEVARPVILTPLPGRRWRVYLQPSSEASDLVADALEVLEPYTPGIRIVDVENPARFHCHSRVAERFRAGRVLLAGDAAHTCSPTEGHGMNTGIQDAFNLGWKLALVCRGESAGGLLDSYEAERLPVASRVAGSGADAEAGQGLKGVGERAERDAEIARTMADAETVHSEAVALAELDRSYAESPIVAGAGGRLPETDAVQPADGKPRSLHELTHRPEHTVFVIGAESGEVRSALESLPAQSPLIGAVYAFSTEGPGDDRVGAIGPATADQLGVEDVTVLAVRPDRYLGFRGDAAGLAGYLDGLTG